MSVEQHNQCLPKDAPLLWDAAAQWASYDGSANYCEGSGVGDLLADSSPTSYYEAAATASLADLPGTGHGGPVQSSVDLILSQAKDYGIESSLAGWARQDPLAAGAALVAGAAGIAIGGAAVAGAALVAGATGMAIGGTAAAGVPVTKILIAGVVTLIASACVSSQEDSEPQFPSSPTGNPPALPNNPAHLANDRILVGANVVPPGRAKPPIIVVGHRPLFECWPDNDFDGEGDAAAESTWEPELRPGMVVNNRDCDDTRADVNTAALEVCDEADNNCDGGVDNNAVDSLLCYVDSDRDGQGAAGTTAVPFCAIPAGYAENADDCRDDDRSINKNAPEICDGQDNNCDGNTDEDYQSRTTQCGQGACEAQGQTQCIDGVEINSCAPHAPAHNDAICNSADDDCDGLTDEDFRPAATECGVGACASTGETTCAAGEVQDSCEPGRPSPELCDGMDNDCDNSIDEGFNLGAQCFVGEGVCRNQGQLICSPDALRAICNAAPLPEQAHHTDADADGHVSTQSSGTSCYPQGPGDDCDDTNPRINPAAVEVCDATNNNCAGGVDEGLARPSPNTQGACVTNFDECFEGEWFEASTNHIPSRERCDTVDNDCNGVTDEGVTNACGTCGPAPEEVCDGGDNDCDGATDEGLLQTFYQNADGDGYGSNVSTIQACVAPQGYLPNGGDCVDDPGINRFAARIYPNRPDSADGVENGCPSPQAVPADQATTYVLNNTDPDGYGNGLEITVQASHLPGPGHGIPDLLIGYPALYRTPANIYEGVLRIYDGNLLPIARGQSVDNLQPREEIWGGTRLAAMGGGYDASHDLDQDGYNDIVMGVGGAVRDLEGFSYGGVQVIYYGGPYGQRPSIGEIIHTTNAPHPAWYIDHGIAVFTSTGSEAEITPDVDGDGMGEILASRRNMHIIESIPQIPHNLAQVQSVFYDNSELNGVSIPANRYFGAHRFSDLREQQGGFEVWDSQPDSGITSNFEVAQLQGANQPASLVVDSGSFGYDPTTIYGAVLTITKKPDQPWPNDIHIAELLPQTVQDIDNRAVLEAAANRIGVHTHIFMGDQNGITPEEVKVAGMWVNENGEQVRRGIYGNRNDDLLIGVPDEDRGTLYAAPGDNIIHSPSGTVTRLNGPVRSSLHGTAFRTHHWQTHSDPNIRNAEMWVGYGMNAQSDINGDGIPDLVIGSDRFPVDGGNSGELAERVNFIFPGGADMMALSGMDIEVDAAPEYVTDCGENHEKGLVTGGDFDGDGISEFMCVSSNPDGTQSRIKMFRSGE